VLRRLFAFSSSDLVRDFFQLSKKMTLPKDAHGTDSIRENYSGAGPDERHAVGDLLGE